MAGYIIYSLDWTKFQSFFKHPSQKQLGALVERVSEEVEAYDDDFEGGDPAQDWPEEQEELRELVKQRLSRPDWYGDLSEAGKEIWSQAVWGFCCHEDAADVGFRADHDGIYWDLLELAWKAFKVPREDILPDVALSAFGRRPFRYCPAAEGGADEGEDDFIAWRPMHSMHTPDEVRRMLDELRSIAPAVEGAKNKQAINDYDALVEVLEQVAEEGRMLFIQVDT